MFRLLCKIVSRPVGRLVGLELMRDDPVLNFHIFNSLDKNLFLNMFIKPKFLTIKYNFGTIKNKPIWYTYIYIKKKVEENTDTCNAACWTNKEILNRCWYTMVIEVSAIWNMKELLEGKLNSMWVKSSNFWSDLIFFEVIY